MTKPGRPIKEGPKKKRYMITLDEEVKKEATAILAKQGLKLSTAVEYFLRTVISEQGFHVSFDMGGTGSRVDYAVVELPDEEGTTGAE